MQLQRVMLRNFKCFEHLDFSFPTTGLHLLKGQTPFDDPSVDGNGAGKSTILSAICWAIFDKTADGSRAGDLLNYTSKKSYSVELVFDSFSLQRTWKPNGVFLDGKEVDEDVVAAKFGLTFEQFLYSIYFAQSNSHFVDLGASDKLSFLSSLFELDSWTRRSDACKAEVAKLNTQLIEVDAQERACNEVLQTADETLTQLNEQRVKWQEQMQCQLNDMRFERQELQKQIIEIDTSDIDALKADGDAVIVAAELKLKENRKENVEKQRQVIEAEADLSQVGKQLNKMLLKDNQECPECQQLVPTEHVFKITTGLSYKQEELEEELEIRKQALQVTSDDVVTGERKLIDLREQQKEIVQLVAESKAIIAANVTVNRQIEKLSESIQTLSDAPCPMDQTISHLQNKTEASKKKLEELVTVRMSVDLEIEKNAYWQKHFPLLRLSILQEVAEELEIYFCQAFSRVGLSDWTCVIQTERQLANESMKKELTVLFFKGEQEIKYKSLSGGERQRVKLATALGISELIKSRLQCDWDLLLVDEPSNGISPAGVNAMLEMFREIADQGQTVLLAEHQRVEDSGLFDGIIMVTKGEDGNSSVVQDGELVGASG